MSQYAIHRECCGKHTPELTILTIVLLYHTILGTVGGTGTMKSRRWASSQGRKTSTFYDCSTTRQIVFERISDLKIRRMFQKFLLVERTQMKSDLRKERCCYVGKKQLRQRTKHRCELNFTHAACSSHFKKYWVH